MSVLVEIPPEKFDKSAFEKFAPSADFSLGNARALMWFSQLGYETGQSTTLQAVVPFWKFKPVRSFTRRQIGPEATYKTCGIVGERDDAVVLVFGGTDPGIWETVATDANVPRNAETDVHTGFQAAFDAARDDVDEAIQLSRANRTPLFIAGHSLGGALAVLAAKYASTIDNCLAPCAVYTFGMPRVGGETFRGQYNGNLGQRTPLVFPGRFEFRQRARA